MTKPLNAVRRFFHTQKQKGFDSMNLKDTIEMMQSEDYKERFKAEYYQLEIRTEKLKAMLDKWDAGELSFKPTCPREHRLLSVLLGSLLIFFANYS